MKIKDSVKKYFPNADVKVIKSQNNKPYSYFLDGCNILGKGESNKKAWKAASRNMIYTINDLINLNNDNNDSKS